MPAPKILVVDDQPINVQLLKRKLEREGIQVVTAYTGMDALEFVKKDKIDLILLDVMMPDMDGIEVCEHLQTDEETRSIPVIFITARSSKEGKLEGLSVGAVDYITKPIDLDETLARVQTQLRFVQINREVVDLQRRLSESRRAATIGAMTQGIAHNLNNLLGVVTGYIELIKKHCDKPDQVRQEIQSLDEAVQRIIVVIKQLSSVAVRSQLPVMKKDLQQLLENSVRRYQAENKITEPVTIENPLGNLVIETDDEVFEDALAKILINAWESYDSRPGAGGKRPITIKTELVDRSEGKFLKICVEDMGGGINPRVRDSMFEPFVSTKHNVGVGMGLTIARHSFSRMDGEVMVTDRPGGGARAVLLHPIQRVVRKKEKPNE